MVTLRTNSSDSETNHTEKLFQYYNPNNQFITEM